MWSRLGAVLALSAGMLLVSAPAAQAESPVDLDGAYILDTVGVVGGDEARVLDALDALYERAGIQLFVVYVDRFTGAADGDWATQTAIENGLGTSDILLAIATVDRNFEVSVADDSPLTDAQLATVESDYLIPQLRDDNWAQAAIDAAEGYGDVATGSGGDPDTAPVGGDDEAGGGIPVLPIVGGIAVIGVGALVVIRARRNSADASLEPDRLSLKDLDRRAGSLLVQLDDSLKTSEQELGFAVAQFGDAATADFTTALASAREKVARAFALRQSLDDAERDSMADQRAWTTEIIDLCTSADAELDAQADAFDALRDLEKRAPEALAEARASLAAARARRATAAETLAALTSRYAAAATASVIDNLPQADKLVAFAEGTIATADAAIAAGKPSEAAIAVRSAQAAAGQVESLFVAIDTLATDLAAASDAFAAAVSDTRSDITAARALPQDPTSAPLTALITAAESALSTADESDPVAGLEHVQRANAALEEAFVGVRDKQAEIAAAASRLPAAMTGAQSQVAAAEQFITTRRGGIGETARTRVSEAQRHLTEATAMSASDPVAALAEAARATALAARALELARSDVSARENPSQFDYGSDGADLGGILSDLFLGGSGGSSGGGGWFSGGGGSSRSSYRSSRSSRSGSFGGSSRSSSRSSGGRRSRGGRF